MTGLPRRLTASEGALLCALADPVGPTPSRQDVVACDGAVLMGAALVHGVDPVVARKLRGLDLSEYPSLCADLAAAAENLVLANAITMALDAHRDAVCAAMRQAGIAFGPVKGAAFARDLYPELADRPYSDIDLLVADADLARAGDVMAALGYSQHRRDLFDKSESNREQKWVRQGELHLLIELHTDLVHVARLRRRLSFGFAELELATDGGRRPAAGYLATAVVHAAAGHKFHNLKLLVDVLQAIRVLDPSDVEHLAVACGRLRMAPELAMCLHLTGALWPSVRDDGNWLALAQIASPDSVPHLVTAEAVWNAHDRSHGASRLRRHAFRWYQLTR